MTITCTRGIVLNIEKLPNSAFRESTCLGKKQQTDHCDAHRKLESLIKTLQNTEHIICYIIITIVINI